MAAKRLGLVVDTKRCMGCHTCALACKAENNLPDGTFWNRVMTVGGEAIDTSAGTYPNATKLYLTVSCQHCENPACTRVCPVGATTKDEETGIVHQDYDRCIGCRMCIAACPYTGVRSFNWEEPKYSIDTTLGGAQVPLHQKHVVEKCVLCEHRLIEGELPSCVTACPAYARHFGDFSDPVSEVSGLIAAREYKQLLPEEGTSPSVYYLV
ncbi:MAG: 4Fe-4S dicluster domain-containing protein [Coriobacteriales bacterium]|jgi:molybdopterin-containing oxidoreductase family iron-sulfur binding subunit|nr:4Fe-4S dicluster domain-containing protein [Coriobacteriales bacterium]